jgi:hypothetical protein
MVTIKEVKSTIAVSIAAAFGFIIALLWKDVIIGIMQKAGFWREGGFPEWSDAAVGVVVVIIITVICVLGILFITKWGGVEKK